jgi:hypothetical protein
MSASDDKAGLTQSSTTERITVTLLAKVAEELKEIQKRTGLSKTDAVNRSITVYNFIDQQMSDGNLLIIRNQNSGQEQQVRFF